MEDLGVLEVGGYGQTVRYAGGMRTPARIGSHVRPLILWSTASSPPNIVPQGRGFLALGCVFWGGWVPYPHLDQKIAPRGVFRNPGYDLFGQQPEIDMLTAAEVQTFLRQFEPLREVNVEELSQVLIAPWHVRLHGMVLVYGEPHGFETELDLREFGGQEDLMKLAKQLLYAFAGAAEHVKRGQAAL